VLALTPVVQSILYAFITKSVGSVFRVRDDWQAPPQILRNTAEREGILLALTTVFTTATQFMLSPMLAPLLKRVPQLAKYELLFRAGANAAGIFVAEATSRLSAPKNYWTSPAQPVQTSEIKTMRLSPQPLQSPVTFARTFSYRPPLYPGGFSL
jgi:hypothetical protein